MRNHDDNGFNPCDLFDDDKIDRTVPKEENYYGYEPVDYDFNSKSRDVPPVEDNQFANNYNNNYEEQYEYGRRQFEAEQNRNIAPPQRSVRQGPSGGGNHSPNRNKNKDKSGKRRKRHRLNPIKILLLIILVLALGCYGLADSVLNKIIYDDKVDNQYVQQSDLKSDSKVTNILLLGVDKRSKDQKESRSDTMMLISVDQKNKAIKLTSFLRDSWVYIPCHKAKQRLNAACTYGGYEGVVDTIEYNYGVDINSYVVADFDMFKVIVDAIDGVTVNVTKAEANEVTNHPVRYGNVKLKAGKHKLTGKQALAYCRIRKIDTDFMRTKRQRTVMQAILKKVKSTNPASLYKMAKNAAPYIETDMTKSQLTKFALKAISCSGTMHQTRIPADDTWSYAYIDGNSVISVDTDKNKTKLIDYIYKSSGSEYDK